MQAVRSSCGVRIGSTRCSTKTTTAPAERDTNEFGKSDAERDRILDDLAKVEPVLRAGAIAEIDTRVPLDEVVDALERIADTVARR
jgi:hypothetical protein